MYVCMYLLNLQLYWRNILKPRNVCACVPIFFPLPLKVADDVHVTVNSGSHPASYSTLVITSPLPCAFVPTPFCTWAREQGGGAEGAVAPPALRPEGRRPSNSDGTCT